MPHYLALEHPACLTESSSIACSNADKQKSQNGLTVRPKGCIVLWKRSTRRVMRQLERD